jgi:hypothetical protein
MKELEKYAWMALFTVLVTAYVYPRVKPFLPGAR